MALDPVIIPALVLLAGAVLAAGVNATRSLQVAAGAALAALAASVAVVLLASADPIDLLLSVYTAAVAAVVAGYSRRHLDGDVRARRYSASLLAVAGAASAVVVSDNLVVVAVAWVAVSAGVTALFGHHIGLAATDDLVGRWRRTAAIADVTLVLALVVLALAAGTVSVAGVAEWAAQTSSAALPLATVLLFVATAARSGLWPFSRWLPLSVVAPAPVSALLHAGVVNAPVVVLIALTPVWSGVPLADVALAVLGFGTALAIFPRKLVRPDVKTRLAWSTAAQMGFMVGLVAIGAPVLAVVHMVLHGLYKASAFLGAGGQIADLRRPSLQKAEPRTALAGAGAGLLLGAVLIWSLGVWQHPVAAVTMLIAVTAGGYGLLSLRARPQVRVVAAAVAVLAVTLVAALPLVAEETLGTLAGGGGVSDWAVALVLAAAASAAAWVLRLRPPRVWAMLHRWSEPTRVRHPFGDGAAGRGTSLDAWTAPSSRRDAQLVREQLTLAGAAMPPSWSWRGFVAANPLDGLVDRPFADAVAGVASGRGWATLPGLSSSAPTPPDVVDRLVAGWLAAWADEGDTAWPAPGRMASLWGWFRSVGVLDPALGRQGRARVQQLPDDPTDVVVAAVVQAGESVDACEVWLRHELLRLPGWAGYLGRRGTARAELATDPLLDLLAVRAAVRHALQLPAPVVEVPEPAAATERALARLAAAESAYRVPLLHDLASRPLGGADTVGRADADVVFCIDPRSEPVRRHLEGLGRYRTVGFAGFFGFALTTEGDGGSTVHHPVPLDGAVCLPQPAREAGTGDLLRAALKGGLDSVVGGFAAVDVAALSFGAAVGRTVAPRRFGKSSQPPDMSAGVQPSRELVDAAEGFLRMTNLAGRRTAPVVVIVGHGSTSTNNPGEAAFDCGACGGQRGGLNAALAAQTLNDPRVRVHLRARGVELPDDTVFVAAEHDTGRAVVTARPSGRGGADADRVARVVDDLDSAAAAAAAEQGRRLPLLGARNNAARGGAQARSADWATVRHEWGLAGNAAFIAAPRELTRGLDLGGRVFLHDYDAASDTDRSVLATILTAPLVVAQWINAQYFFSTLDPENLGAGSKTAHNPVGGIGVVSGAGGDLRHGLAEQSVRYRGRKIHEPVRLIAVVAAEVAAIEDVLVAHPSVDDLVVNEWITLCALDPSTGQIQRVRGVGRELDAPMPPVALPTAPRAGISPAARAA